MRSGWMVTACIFIVSNALFAAEAQPKIDVKIVNNFKVRWSSVQYNKSVSVENPDVSQSTGQRSETLNLAWQAEVQDPNLVLGTSLHGVITQLTDGKGQDVAVGTAPVNPHETYEALRYDRQFRQPVPASRWRTFIEQTILRRPPQPPGPPQFVTKLQPCRMIAQLDMGLLGQGGGELRTVKGYFHALVPGSIERVEVPFEPNNTWVSLMPGLEIQVQEAVCGNSFYRYQINARPQGGGFSGPLAVGQPVPNRFVVAQQLIGDDGKPLDHFHGSPWLPAHVGGQGSGSGSVSRIKAIRFLIAVDAKEYEIPFELQHVPLPKP
ncbi:MAG: hypothetical protein ACM3VT_13175 [Solirubrobacterales bacterium]